MDEWFKKQDSDEQDDAKYDANKKKLPNLFCSERKKKLSYVSITRSKYAAKYVSFDFIAMLFLSRQILVANFHAKHSKW